MRVRARLLRWAARWLAPYLVPYLLDEPRTFGDASRLVIHPTAQVHNALFNTASGTIEIQEHVFMGHDVAVLTGVHDATVIGERRADAVPESGRNIRVERGAWLASRAIVLGPCNIGEHAVVAAGAVVTTDVPSRTVVAGIPARPVKRL